MNRIWLLTCGCILLSIVFFTIGCSESKTIPQSSWERLIAIRAEALACYSELMAELYNAHIHSQPTSAEEIRCKYRDLFSRSNIELVQKIENSFEDSFEKQRAKYLRMFLIEGCLAEATAPTSRFLDSLAQSEIIPVDSDTICYQDIAAILISEPNREKRRKAFKAQLSYFKKRNLISQKIRGVEDSILSELGYSDAVSYLEEYRGADFQTLKKLALRFIERTDSVYFSLFEELAPLVAGVRFDSFRGWDFPYLVHGGLYSNYFPADSATVILSQTLAGIGIEIDTFQALSVDFENHRGKTSRAATYPVQIPNDIRLVVSLTEGVNGYAAYYHESGHALHYLHTTELDFEFNYLGDNSVRELFAFLIEHLLDEQSYLRSNFGFSDEDLKQFLKFQAFSRLTYVRSYCADFLFELDFYSDNTGSQTTFKKIRQPVFRYSWSDIEPESYLNRVDRFYSADYLQAWFIEPQLREKLRADFGVDYYNNRELGCFLEELWGYGGRYSLNQLGSTFGIEEITVDPLIEEITAMMR